MLCGITSQTPQCSLSGFQWTRVSLKAICTLNLSAAYLHNLSGEISEVTHNQTKHCFLTLKPNGKTFSLQEINEDKIQFLQRHVNLIFFHFPNSRKFKKSSSCLSTEHKIGNCPVFLAICKISQLLLTKLRLTYVGSKFKSASHAKSFTCYCSTATPTRELCLVRN